MTRRELCDDCYNLGVEHDPGDRIFIVECMGLQYRLCTTHRDMLLEEYGSESRAIKYTKALEEE